MSKLILRGGPHDGNVIDLDWVCNENDSFCPVHGFGFCHLSINEGEKQLLNYKEYEYDRNTGGYLGEIKEKA